MENINPADRDIFSFTLNKTNLIISHNPQGVFLRSPEMNYLEKLALPSPEQTPDGQSSPTSTYDTRDSKTSLSFRVANSTSDKAEIEVAITQSDEYWYYGSLGDDWHPRSETTRKMLYVEMQKGKLQHKFENFETGNSKKQNHAAADLY